MNVAHFIYIALFFSLSDVESSETESTNKEKSKKGSKSSNKSSKIKGAKGKFQNDPLVVEEAIDFTEKAAKSSANKTIKKRKKADDEPVVISEEGIPEVETVQPPAKKATKRQKKDSNSTSNNTEKLAEDKTTQPSANKASKRHKGPDEIETAENDRVHEVETASSDPSAKKTISKCKTDANGSKYSMPDVILEEMPDVILEEIIEEPVAKKPTKPRGNKSLFRPIVGARAVKPRVGKALEGKTTQQCNPEEKVLTSPTNHAEDIPDATRFPLNTNSDLPSTSVPTPLDSLLKSPLGQMSLEQGGLTVVENSGAPSFLVPPALAEANPAFAQAEPGSLVLVTQPNPGNPENQLVHVYRISAPMEEVTM